MSWTVKTHLFLTVLGLELKPVCVCVSFTVTVWQELWPSLSFVLSLPFVLAGALNSVNGCTDESPSFFSFFFLFFLQGPLLCMKGQCAVCFSYLYGYRQKKQGSAQKTVNH